MQQYIFKDQYRGKPRELLILMSANGTEYRVFCEAIYLGSIIPVIDDQAVTIWRTAYNILKPIAAKIGEYITSCDKVITPISM